jgi:NAD(P)-dependent dehydrogenase (short-subunit alcohol dehydrogenase family)
VYGITVNCIHPGVTRTVRTLGLRTARARQLGMTPEEVEQRDFAPDSPRGNSIGRMVDALEIVFVSIFSLGQGLVHYWEADRGKWRHRAAGL